MTNMYKLSVRQWNPFVGCNHNCVYCEQSFQRSLKRWAAGKCDKCFSYVPHIHPERLTYTLPKTGYMQFIFACSTGDVAYCPTPYLESILKRISYWSDRTFLMQSKDPQTFMRVERILPKNLIVGTTIESDELPACMDGCKAPKPVERWTDLLSLNHRQKMVTIEPVMKFHLDVIVEWMDYLSPVMIWLGYDSKECKLDEPSLSKTKRLHYALASRGHTVILKKMRKAWWEK